MCYDVAMDAMNVKEVLNGGNRQRVFEAVVASDGKKSVGDLAKELGMHQPSVSQALVKLEELGAVQLADRRLGARHYYTFNRRFLFPWGQWLDAQLEAVKKTGVSA